VDVAEDRFPLANYALIVAIVIAFIFQVTMPAEVIKPFVLDGFTVSGLLGYIWLHGGILHLLGNLLFLRIFGNAVCAKVGNFRYLLLYIIAGVLAGITHVVFRGGACIGASGAINGVVGMYLIFFPDNPITCYLLLVWIWRFTVSSYWIILYWLAFDIYGAFNGGGFVAYFAHLGGFAAGITMALLLLKTGMAIMYRDEESLPQLIARWRGKIQPASIEENYNPFARDLAAIEKEKKLKAEIEAQKSADDHFIRFACVCGQKIKVPKRYAGKKGRCPGCSKYVRIPQIQQNN
jgi:membrane associated rhomboid family serine protease